MAFFYEAEAPVWKYKERYNWKQYPKKVSTKLEKLYQKVVNGDKSVTTFEWKDDKQQTQKINVENLSAQNSSSYYRNMDVSRDGYPYPTSGDKNKLKKMFKKYADPEDLNSMHYEKIPDFLKELTISDSSIDALILQGMCQNEDLFDFTQKNFVDGLAKCGCSNAKDIKTRVGEIKAAVFKKKKVCKKFANFLFKLMAEEKQKVLPIQKIEMPEGAPSDSESEEEGAPKVLLIFDLVFAKNAKHFPLATKFLEFLKGQSRVSRDDWEMTAEFLHQHETVESVDDPEDWPTMIEAFVTANMPKKATS